MKEEEGTRKKFDIYEIGVIKIFPIVGEICKPIKSAKSGIEIPVIKINSFINNPLY